VVLGLALAVAIAGPAGPAHAWNPFSEFTALTAGSGPFAIARGPDGNLWFTELSGDRIGRITPAGVVTEFPIPTTGGSPVGITAGPDGNLWFTEAIGQIGRITPGGAITEFPLPVAGEPFGITTGPDGNLWYTVRLGDRIGRVTPAGTITEFPLPTPGAGARGIAAGPDGNLWFTEPGVDQIGRITPAGVVTEFPIPTPNGLPFGISAGPDGNLWFIETLGNRVGRVTPGGTVTEFPIPGPAPMASNVSFGIAVGPDRDLWFVQADGSGIGRMTTGGVFVASFFAPTAGAGMSDIAAGPGGLWFTQTIATRAGRLRVAGKRGDFSHDGRADVVTGTGPGGGPHVRVFSGRDGSELLSLFAYDAGFTGGVRVTACDLDGDGVPEIVTAAGAGGGPHVRAFDGRTGQPYPGPVGSFFAYDPGVFNGAFVGCADVNGDGVPDVITGAGPGGAPHVRVWNGVDGAELVGFFAYDPAFTGGVFVGP
jgi:virginiamycin B lyase